MKIDRELERRAYMFYESIDNYINKHIGSDEQVKNDLISLLKYVIFGGANMIKPKYAIGYRFKDSRANCEFEVIEKNYTNSGIIYYVLNLNNGVVGPLPEQVIDNILGGANAKKQRKK